jgi:hypothetical protein
LHEYPAAVRKYLEHFKLQVDLGSDAWARCRHPLLLRFFCEAYARPTSGPQGFEPVRLGRIEEIRLKPLFDDYWSAKTKQLAGARAYADAVTAEQCLLSLARHMLDSNSAVVTTIEFPRITGVRDLTSNASLYLSLVDEDVIIEEHPTRRLKVRRVVFVYEEFMEYVAARELYSILKHEAPTGLLDLFNMLKKKAGEFVNSLGIAEYVVACLLDDGLHKSAFALLSMMAQEGGPWDAIVANVFTKYDQAIEMVLTFVKTSRDLQSIQRLLSSVGRDSRPAMTDICVELGFRVAFPAVLTFEHVRHGALPAELPESAPCLWDTNPTVGRGIVRLIATSIDAFSVNPARSVLWRSWKGNRKYVDPGDRHELVRALWNLVGGSPRRSGILAYACNGLFDEHEEIRKAAAFLGRDSDRPIVREIREWRLERETDPEVRELLLLQTAAAMPFMN